MASDLLISQSSHPTACDLHSSSASTLNYLKVFLLSHFVLSPLLSFMFYASWIICEMLPSNAFFKPTFSIKPLEPPFSCHSLLYL